MDPLHDPRCLVTTEALFLDGANGVCGAPRQGAGSAPPLLGTVLFVVVLAAAIGVSRVRSTNWRVALAAIVAIAALPGLWALAATRADRPGEVETSASRVVRAHDAVHAFASAHGGATLRTETEISIVPIARLALVGTGSGDAPIDLFDDTLEDGCRDLESSLLCGTAPHVRPSEP